jgi:hypothetical protein
MSKSPRLTKNSSGDWDLLLQDGKFQWVEDGSQAAQLVAERLQTFRGEYSIGGLLSTGINEGTRWYEVIFRTDKSNAEKELEIKRVVMATPNIDKILEFSWSLSDHVLSINLKGKTAWGDITLSEEITSL